MNIISACGTAGFITVNVGNDWMSNGVRASFEKAEQCRQPLPRDLKLVLVKLLSATAVTDAVGSQAGIIGAEAENDHSLSRAAAREGVRAASAGLLVEMMSNRLVNLIQYKIIPHFPIRAIHFKANCIWVNGKPIDKLLISSGKSASIFQTVSRLKNIFKKC